MNLKKFGRKASEGMQENVQESAPVRDGIVDDILKDDTLTIFLSGKIDATNFENIQDFVFNKIEQQNFKHLILDMGAVNYVSSAGLRMFSAVNKIATDRGISYKLIEMSSVIMKLFQMTGYASTFRIELKSEE